MPDWRIMEGDCRDVLAGMAAGSVHTVVTSPPYFGLRDYGTGEWEGGDPACDHRTVATGGNPMQGPNKGNNNREGAPFREACGRCGARRVDRQIGLEPTPDEFVAALVGVFREVRRVLRDDGTVWLNLGDSYNAGRDGGHPGGPKQASLARHDGINRSGANVPGCKPKDLLGIPWLVAFALRADGWYLRSDIVWSKPNPMPESVTDRPTKAHEYVFLLSKAPRYYFDADAIREGAVSDHPSGNGYARPERETYKNADGSARGQAQGWTDVGGLRNKRSVWTVATQPYAGAHFATFPPKLIEPCILAGCPERACGECGAPWVRVVEREAAQRIAPQTAQMARERHFRETRPVGQRGNAGMPCGQAMAGSRSSRTVGFEPSCSHGDGSASGVVLDPFAGAGTTGIVALQHGREFVGVELNPEYAQMARARIELAVRLGFRPPETGPGVPAEQAALFDV